MLLLFVCFYKTLLWEYEVLIGLGILFWSFWKAIMFGFIEDTLFEMEDYNGSLEFDILFSKEHYSKRWWVERKL